MARTMKDPSGREEILESGRNFLIDNLRPQAQLILSGLDSRTMIVT
jgi:hypothetical protein